MAWGGPEILLTALVKASADYRLHDLPRAQKNDRQRQPRGSRVWLQSHSATRPMSNHELRAISQFEQPPVELNHLLADAGPGKLTLSPICSALTGL